MNHPESSVLARTDSDTRTLQTAQTTLSTPEVCHAPVATVHDHQQNRTRPSSHEDSSAPWEEYLRCKIQPESSGAPVPAGGWSLQHTGSSAAGEDSPFDPWEEDLRRKLEASHCASNASMGRGEVKTTPERSSDAVERNKSSSRAGGRKQDLLLLRI